VERDAARPCIVGVDVPVEVSAGIDIDVTVNVCVGVPNGITIDGLVDVPIDEDIDAYTDVGRGGALCWRFTVPKK
jgi:hypothetical protein